METLRLGKTDLRSFEDLDEDDWRRRNPRFQGSNFEANLALVDAIGEMANDKGCFRIACGSDLIRRGNLTQR